MASLPIISFAPATVRVYAATAAKEAGGSKEEKSLLDWILGGMQKQDQFYETDPILKKVEDKSPPSGRGTTNGRKNSASVPQPQKKKGGFGLGGLFAKKWYFFPQKKKYYLFVCFIFMISHDHRNECAVRLLLLVILEP